MQFIDQVHIFGQTMKALFPFEVFKVFCIQMASKGLLLLTTRNESDNNQSISTFISNLTSQKD